MHLPDVVEVHDDTSCCNCAEQSPIKEQVEFKTSSFAHVARNGYASTHKYHSDIQTKKYPRLRVVPTCYDHAGHVVHDYVPYRGQHTDVSSEWRRHDTDVSYGRQRLCRLVQSCRKGRHDPNFSRVRHLIDSRFYLRANRYDFGAICLFLRFATTPPDDWT